MRIFSSLLFVFLAASGSCLAQVTDGAWVYPSATGNLLYQHDERGQRITDFSQIGYRGGTEPLPNVNAVIPQTRWVDVSPGTGDDTALIQAAIDSVEALTPDANGWRGVVFLNAGEYQLATTITINASGVVLKGAGDDPSTGTRLRATDPRQYTLISVAGSDSRTAVAGTTHDLTQKLVPAGTRTFEVDSTAGLAVGDTVIVKRPSTAEWIADIDMDQLAIPWTAGSKDLHFDRTITRIDGNWITVDVPLPQTFEQIYGGGQIWRYSWTGRIQQVGIEDIYGFSYYANSTDELHAWVFIGIGNTQHGWVRNITAQYFGYAAVSIGAGAKWLTVADSQCLDPISIIDGGRRYSFNNDDAECSLFVNCYARKGRHDFVFGSSVPGPNAFVHCTADTAYADGGPHHRWSVGGLFDLVTVNGNELNVQNRGNSGTGHGWAGAYMTVWNCKANTFRVRNPPTARNWLVGSIGTISSSSAPVGADPAGTYDSSGPSGTGKAVHTRSLYYGQLQQRLKWPDSDFHEVWLGDVDQYTSTGGTGEAVNCDATWLTQVEALGAQPAVAEFDELVGSRHVAFTVDFARTPGEKIVAASLTLSLRAIGSATADNIWLDGTASPQTFASLGWNPVSTTAPTVHTLEISPAMLSDGRLNVALGTNCAVDYAVLHLQVQKPQPSASNVALVAVADAHVQGGTSAAGNFGTATTLVTKEDSSVDLDREAFIRWDLSGITGKIVQAKVRLMTTNTGQARNENAANFVSNDTWSETAVTFATKPAAEKLFAQWLPVANQAVEFSVTPQVLDAQLGDGKLSLRIASTDNHGAAGDVSYASREDATAANRPQLILTIENPPTAVVKAATGSTLSTDSAWTNGFVPVNPDTATWNSTSLAGTMTFENDLNWAGLIVSNPSGPLTFNSSQFLLLGSAGIDMSASSVDLTLTNPVHLNADQNWNVAAGRSITANGPISGSLNLKKSGTGTLVFSGSNTFTGSTAIEEGTLRVDTGGTLGANSTSLSIGTGSVGVTGTLGNLTLDTTATLGPLAIKSNNTGNCLLSIASGKTLTVAGFESGVIGTDPTRTNTKLITGTAGTGGQLVVNGDFMMSKPGSNATVDLSGLASFNLQSPAPAGTLSLGANLRSNGSLTLANSTNTINVGTLSLGVTGSNAGALNTLKLGAGTNSIQAQAINIGGGKGAGQIVFAGNGGSVVITGPTGSGSSAITIGHSSVGTYPNVGNNLFLAGHTASVNASTVTIGQKSGNGGSTVVANVTFDTGNFNANTIQMGVAVAGSGSITSNLTVGGPTANSAANGVMNISGNLLLAAATAGTATPNSTLVINGDTVNVNTVASAANGIYDTSEGAGTSTTSLILAGGTLDLNGGTIGGTIGTGKKNIGTLNFQSGTLRNVAQINGSDGLTKTTTGTLILAGTNTYTGPTAITAGKVLVNGNQSTASGDVTVSASATLGGTGVIGGNTTIEPNGRLEFNLSTTPASHDKLELAASRTLTFSGASVLTITSSGGSAPGTYTLLTAPGGIFGNLPTLNLPATWAGSLSIVSNSLVINVTSSAGGDVTAPTLVSMVDNAGSSSMTVHNSLICTVTFSEHINAATVNASDFGNAGTSLTSIGAITETSPGVFTVAVTPTTVGTLQLRVNAGAVITDVAGNALSTATALVDDTTITVNPLNFAPQWAANPVNEVNATENAGYSSTLADNASDADGDTLTFSKVGGPSWLSVAANGSLSGTPTSSDVGANSFTVSVSDGIEAAVQATLNITVIQRGPGTLYSSGAKTWNTTTANWGTVTGGPYTTAIWRTGDSAIFEGTAGTVTLGQTISIKNLTINTKLYVIKGSTLNFTAGTITTPRPASSTAPGATIESNITGTPAVNAFAQGTNEYFTFKPAAGGSMVLGAINGNTGNGAGIISFQGGAGSNSTVASVNGPKSYFEGSGTWTLTGLATSYGNSISSGTVIVSTGTLQANNRSTSLNGGTLHYNNPAAVRDSTAATGGDNDFRLRGGSIDNTSGAAITTSTWNPNMTWEANWTFIGSSGANSNLFLGNGSVILTTTPQVTVQNAATTLAVGGLISGSGFGLTKAGAGTLELRGASTYTGETTVNAGTLKLGANNVIPDASNVTIGTATLDADIRTDTAGTLDVNGSAVINLGTGAALAFADSKAVDWTGGTLNITGTLGTTSLRFGDSADDLTGNQLALISVNGSGLGTYILDSNGYLVVGGGGTAYDTWTAVNAPTTGNDPAADEDVDGVSNVLEYVLGGTISTNDLDKLPVIATSGGNMTFTFLRSDVSESDTTLTLQYGADLSDANLSTDFEIGAVSAGPDANGVVCTVKDNAADADLVTVTLPPLSGSSRMFVRLRATMPSASSK